jgi:4'-phosphopantetheinyl transferase
MTDCSRGAENGYLLHNTIVLPRGEIHVWTAEVETLDPDWVAAILSSQEQDRAARFYFEKHRRAYRFAHAALRSVLAPYLGSAAAEIRYGEGEFGKPYLEEPAGSRIEFNMAHSGDVVVIAVAAGRRVGIDVEQIRALEDLDAVAESHFTPAERALLANAGARQSAFFTCWTRKEAYIKAVGKGLSMDLNSFDTSIEPGLAGRRLNEWWLCDLAVSEGYAAALVVGGGLEKLVYRRWCAPAQRGGPPRGA